MLKKIMLCLSLLGVSVYASEVQAPVEESQSFSLELKDKLFETVHSGDVDALQELLDQNPGLVNVVADSRNNVDYHNTALIEAAHSGTVAVVRCLVEHGADIHATGRYGYNAFLKAAMGGNLDVMKYLFEQDKSLMNSVNDFNYDVLRCALSNGNDTEKVVEWLIEQEGDIMYGDLNRFFSTEIAFTEAAEKGLSEIIKILFKSAPKDKRQDMLEFRNGDQTALDLAKANNHDDAAALLQSYADEISEQN